MAQRRVIILLFDSFGIGAADDAKEFGDEGANTLDHIAEACFNDKASRAGVRQGPLHIPNKDFARSMSSQSSAFTGIIGQCFRQHYALRTR